MLKKLCTIGLVLLTLQGAWSLIGPAPTDWEGKSRNPILTDLFVGVPAEASYRPTVIKSVQRGTITIGAGSGSATAAISAVTLANSSLVWLGNDYDGGATTNYDDANTYVDLTSTTQVTAYRASVAAQDVVSFEVIEFYGGVIRSVQRGTVLVAAGATSNTTAITAVTTSKSQLTRLGIYTTVDGGTAAGIGGLMHRLSLASSTSVALVRVASAGSVNHTEAFQVLEFR